MYIALTDKKGLSKCFAWISFISAVIAGLFSAYGPFADSL